jgi:hypothetical protein
MKTKIYDLYCSEIESTYIFFERDNPSTLLESLPVGSRLIWSVLAKSFEIAQLKKHEFLGWEPYKPMILSENDLAAYLPEDKQDVDNAQLLVNLGYPKVQPVLSEIMVWLQDMNWPVSGVFALWLSSIGRELKPYIQSIFNTNDAVWKYWILYTVLGNMKKCELAFFRDDLEKLSCSIQPQDLAEEIPEMARELLSRLECIDSL